MDTIKQWRRRKGWTQADLAREAGVHLETVSGIETGNHEPRPSTLQKLAGAFDVEVEELFDNPKAPAPASPTPDKEDEERREREEYGEALMDVWANEGERLEEVIKSSPEGFPLRQAHSFSVGHGLAQTLYEEMASTRQPPNSLQEAKERLDAVSARLGALWNQTVHPGSPEELREFQRFAQRRATEALRDRGREEGGEDAQDAAPPPKRG